MEELNSIEVITFSRFCLVFDQIDIENTVNEVVITLARGIHIIEAFLEKDSKNISPRIYRYIITDLPESWEDHIPDSWHTYNLINRPEAAQQYLTKTGGYCSMPDEWKPLTAGALELYGSCAIYYNKDYKAFIGMEYDHTLTRTDIITGQMIHELSILSYIRNTIKKSARSAAV
jgi:hypothetical protein